MQERSRRRLEDIVETTARLVDELGPDSVTTTLIAERLGISVGSIYDYFQDREAIFDEIVSRAIAANYQMSADMRASVTDVPVGSPEAWFERSSMVIDQLAHAYRAEPGFRALWFSQHLSPRMLESMRQSDETQARRLLAGLASIGLRLDCPDPLQAMRMYVGLIDKGLDLAFRHDPVGSAAIIAETKQVVRRYLGVYLVPAHQVDRR